MWNKVRLSSLAVLFLDLGLVIFLIYDFGFKDYQDLRQYKLIVLPTLVLALIVFNLYKYRLFKRQRVSSISPKINLYYLSILVIVEIVTIISDFEISLFDSFFNVRYVIEYGLLIYFFIRISFLVRKIYAIYFNPAILFVGSFAIIALGGTFLLMLPASTLHGISFIDALFTATSATSVTGLIVVDTAKDFTPFGQTIILFLFQLGGLGMLTFTSFFAYFFKSGSSFRESLYMKDIMGNNDELGGIMKKVMQVVAFSLIIEFLGALLIYTSLPEVDKIPNQIFFSIFHAISAYCNAGFSLESMGLHDINLRHNYYLQWVVMALIIFGGLGYHIAYNVIQYLKRFTTNLFRSKNKIFISRVILLNTKIVLYTSLILIVAGTGFFLISEKHTNLLEHTTWFGKLTTALFSSVTARTAGFNTVDYADFSIPGILFMIFLMWIGASPASTGGGIKTTTFAIATLNVFFVAKDQPYIEIGTRRIAAQSVRRAFAIMAISLASIGTGILFLLIFNPEFTLIQIAFEVFSAFSTVGVSMGITASLSSASKIVLIILMFLGRIGLLNLMIGLLKNVSQADYSYPEENILIN
ncbi:potassium transporter [Cellulophaga sp. E16_2]|uniref:H(+)-transporting two-sector ATPase n=1 Tax=Cellulophaga algicola (strain DSM 14237 / IC166 / ACAM 630) TaxID=688270 RepID=E6XBU8_CELAD|nr:MULTISPECIES: potassium transporter TrkG [Cellulophaga]ADV48950.1 H(+)-transporting two-sector ATPase [Cellulophaga algicola DSM 14237]MBO0591421.1 potassium transporter [Cellulophaga sp. E16_2]